MTMKKRQSKRTWAAFLEVHNHKVTKLEDYKARTENLITTMWERHHQWASTCNDPTEIAKRKNRVIAMHHEHITLYNLAIEHVNFTIHEIEIKFRRAGGPKPPNLPFKPFPGPITLTPDMFARANGSTPAPLTQTE